MCNGKKLKPDNYRSTVNFTCHQKDETKCFFWPPCLKFKQKVKSIHILILLFEIIKWYLALDIIKPSSRTYSLGEFVKKKKKKKAHCTIIVFHFQVYILSFSVSFGFVLAMPTICGRFWTKD